jgi:hypothetical protein
LEFEKFVEFLNLSGPLAGRGWPSNPYPCICDAQAFKDFNKIEEFSKFFEFPSLAYGSEIFAIYPLRGQQLDFL